MLAVSQQCSSDTFNIFLFSELEMELFNGNVRSRPRAGVRINSVKAQDNET